LLPKLWLILEQVAEWVNRRGLFHAKAADFSAAFSFPQCALLAIF
jgi:hypothetical protein